MIKHLHLAIKNEILTIIAQTDGRSECAASEILFTESALMQKHNVSRTTVRKAVDELIQENIVIRVPGKGVQIHPANYRTSSTDGVHKKNIAIILNCRPKDNVMYDLFLGISQMANKHGYSYNVFNLANKGAPVLEKIDERDFGGVLLAWNSNDISENETKKLFSFAIPIIFLDNIPHGYTNTEIHCVLSDDFKGGFLSACALLTKGHSNVVYVIPKEPEYTQVKRMEGFLSAFETVSHTKVSVLNYTNDLKTKLKKFLTDDNRATAIACPFDGAVVECCEVMDSLGLRYPEQISLVGYSDVKSPKPSSVPISTVNQPFFEMGEAGCWMLIDFLENKTPIQSKIFDVKFVEKDSIAINRTDAVAQSMALLDL